ncbi:transposase, IS4 family protein [Actinoplanes sp. N902-109]|nr:transposase, IS4 family protein [Actinoplanes sp. N902-109]
MLTSGANVPDISRAIDLLDGYPPIAGRHGRPRRRFDVLLADKGYDSEAFRQACRERGTQPIIARRKTARIKGLGKLRYVVEHDHRVTAPVPPPRDSLGTTPGHPRQLGQPRLRPDLLATLDQIPPAEIVLAALTRTGWRPYGSR